MERIQLNRVQLMKLIGIGYFLLLSTINFVSSVANGFFHWTDLVFFLICVAVLVFRNKGILLGFGIINIILWGYLTLAVTDDLVDYCAGIDHYSKPWEYFGVGYTLMLTGVLMSLLVLIAVGLEDDQPRPSSSVDNQ